MLHRWWCGWETDKVLGFTGWFSLYNILFCNDTSLQTKNDPQLNIIRTNEINYNHFFCFLTNFIIDLNLKHACENELRYSVQVVMDLYELI